MRSSVLGHGETGLAADTRERVMQAALLVLSRKGFDAATLKEITDEANANIAAVNYYFRSKDELIRQVIQSLLGAVNRARTEALDAYEAEVGQGAKPSVTRLTEVLIRPMVKLSRDVNGGRALINLLLQARANPLTPHNLLGEQGFDVVHERFILALSRLLPELSREEIVLRYECARGAMMFLLADQVSSVRPLVNLPGMPSAASDETIIAELVAFVSAAFRASSAKSDLVRGQQVSP